MSFQFFFPGIAALWLMGIAAGLLAFRWTFKAVPRRFLPALILSISGIAIGYLGMTRLHIVYSKTVNGQLQWRFDSWRLFLVPLLVGALSLAYTLWKGRKGGGSVVGPRRTASE